MRAKEFIQEANGTALPASNMGTVARGEIGSVVSKPALIAGAIIGIWSKWGEIRAAFEIPDPRLRRIELARIVTKLVGDFGLGMVSYVLGALLIGGALAVLAPQLAAGATAAVIARLVVGIGAAIWADHKFGDSITEITNNLSAWLEKNTRSN